MKKHEKPKVCLDRCKSSCEIGPINAEERLEEAYDVREKAARAALLAGWFQKFLVHRRLRPEEFGGRVHNHLTGAANYPIHADQI